MDARFPAALAQDLRVEADAALGRQYRHRLPGHLLLPEADRSPGQDLGRRAGGNQGNVRQAGHSRGREEVSGRREGPVRERSRLRFAAGRPRQEGRALHRYRYGVARTSRFAARVLRHDHSAGRQQVRGAELGRVVGRLVHLRAEGREDRVPAAGLFPHQCGADGPVRADADHRRRRRRSALRRRLHGADVHEREPALGGGRDRRQAAAPAAGTRRFRTGRTTFTTWSPSGRWPTAIRSWSGSTATSAAG